MTTSALTRTPSGSQPPPARGPHPGIVAAVALALQVATVAVLPLLTGQLGYLDPFADAGASAARSTERRDAFVWAAFLQFCAAVPIAVYAATISTLLRRRGVVVPGPSIALVGGVLAAASASASALTGWALAGPGVSGPVVPALTRLTFALGGVGFAVPLGLLVAGVAVPGLLARLLPRAVALFGLGLAVLAEATALVLLVPQVSYALPVTRFGGLAWLVLAGVLLARRAGAER